MRGVHQGKPVQPHGDLWQHTMMVLEKLPPEPSFTLAFAALLHDAGKPAAKGLQDGRVTFYNHEHAGREIAEQLCRELKLSNTERESITWLVEHHQSLAEATQMRPAKLKRILARPGIAELIELHRADALATTGGTTQVDFCEWYLRHEPDGPINPPPLLTGDDLKAAGLEPGPQFSRLLDRVRELQLDSVLDSRARALDWLARQGKDSSA